MSIQVEYAMYSSRRHDSLLEVSLREELRNRYGLGSVQNRKSLYGFYGEIWEASRDGQRYIIKLDRSPKHQRVLHRNLAVLPHLWRHGLRCIPQVLKTYDGALSISFMSGTLAVFSFLPGEPMEENQHALLFDCLSKVYDVPVLPNLWYETFDTRVERDAAQYIASLASLGTEMAYSLVDFFETKMPMITRFAAKLRHFSARCLRERDHFVITHGDPRRNTLVHAGEAALIDWDDPLYAPPERDGWLFLDTPGELRLFEDALAARGMPYKMREERLAFYGFYMFFQYMREGLSCFFDMQGEVSPWLVEQTVRGFFYHPFIEILHGMADWR